MIGYHHDTTIQNYRKLSTSCLRELVIKDLMDGEDHSGTGKEFSNHTLGNFNGF